MGAGVLPRQARPNRAARSQPLSVVIPNFQYRNFYIIWPGHFHRQRPWGFSCMVTAVHSATGPRGFVLPKRLGTLKPERTLLTLWQDEKSPLILGQGFELVSRCPTSHTICKMLRFTDANNTIWGNDIAVIEPVSLMQVKMFFDRNSAFLVHQAFSNPF